MTKLAFRRRFTGDERAHIELAAMDDPGAATSVRLQAATIRSFLADVAAATDIEPDRQDIRDDLAQLETLGLIAQGRAAAILDAPIQDSEKP